MALFAQDSLNAGVRKRELFGWAMYDFANSGYTTVDAATRLASMTSQAELRLHAQMVAFLLRRAMP